MGDKKLETIALTMASVFGIFLGTFFNLQGHTNGFTAGLAIIKKRTN